MKTRALKNFGHISETVTFLRVKNWVGYLVLHNFVL
nr:MAG TPA: hypothetical protein [Caudoviricetes sp.]